MRRLIVGLGVCSLLMLWGTVSWAGTEAGQKEIGGSASYRHAMSSDYDSDSINIMAKLSYFVTDRISLGFTSTGMYYLGDSDFGLLFLEPESSYHLPISNPDWIPYAGVHAGLVLAGYDEVEASATFGVQGGAKWFAKEDMALDFQLRYTYYDSGDAGGTNDIQIMAGVAYYF